MRRFVVYCFFVSQPPLRTQNIKLLVVDSIENKYFFILFYFFLLLFIIFFFRTEDDIIEYVKESNKSVEFTNYARDKYTGIICKVILFYFFLFLNFFSFLFSETDAKWKLLYGLHRL